MTADELLALVAAALVVIALGLALFRAHHLSQERDAFYRWWGAHTVAEIDDWRRDQ